MTALGAVDLLYWAARLTSFGALALLVGTAFFVAAWWPEGAGHRATWRLVWSAWAVLVVATGALLLLFGPQVAARPLGSAVDPDLLATTLETRMGTAALLRVLVLSVAAPGLALLLSRPPPATPRQRAWRVGGVLAGSAALAATWSIAGHSAVGRQAAVAVTVDVLHLLAMGVWLGGLVALFGGLLRTTEVEVMRRAVPAFSQAAVVCVAVLAVTGAYQSWRQVGAPAALVSTSYGWLLLGKVALVVLLVGLGAASRSWVRRHYGGAGSAVPSGRRARRGPGDRELVRFRTLMAAETGLAAVVLAVTAGLVASQPARAAQLEAAAQQRAERNQADQGWAGGTSGQAPAPVIGSLGFDAGDPAGPGTVDFVLVPATVGGNELHLAVLDHRGVPLDVPEATAVLSLPDRLPDPLPVPVRRLAPGHYLGTVTIPLAGRWRLTVTIRTAAGSQDTVSTPLVVR